METPEFKEIELQEDDVLLLEKIVGFCMSEYDDGALLYNITHVLMSGEGETDFEIKWALNHPMAHRLAQHAINLYQFDADNVLKLQHAIVAYFTDEPYMNWTTSQSVAHELRTGSQFGIKFTCDESAANDLARDAIALYEYKEG